MDFLQLTFKNSFANLPDEFYERRKPTPLKDCFLIDVNIKVSKTLGITPETYQSKHLIDYFNGSKPFSGFEPLAAVYAGHQFGTYVSQLGDGRAILLGEIETDSKQRWELQSKGAGETRYSRASDGRAVLRSTIREYLCSTAMDGLGIPTTHALCMMGSTTDVYRESIEKGALLIRVAPSFVRFGSFEYFHYQSRPDLVKTLADYVIQQDFPHRHEQDNVYLLFFKDVITRTAQLMASWQSVGFAHGVMNTDNMSILGLTLDYGPFGFLDNYNPEFICNHSDYAGRYAFNRQPSIGLWNLRRLAEALTSIISMEDMAEALEDYQLIYSKQLFKLMREKIGLHEPTQEVAGVINELFDLLEKNSPDYTHFFRSLAAFEQQTDAKNNLLRNQFLDREAFDSWAIKYKQQLIKENSNNQERAESINRHNPKFIFRNYLAQQAIEKAEQGDYSDIGILQALLQTPFEEHPQYEQYAALPPEWAKEISVSCSS